MTRPPERRPGRKKAGNSHRENASDASRAENSKHRRTLRGLPLGIWALGLGSMFMDSSSELVHSVLPIYLSAVLGASMATIGLIEGIAEATASITKVFSGLISDRLGKRKPLVVAGYGLAALSKPLFPLAGSVAWVATARFIDRVGKGIRGAPRDALVADITPPSLRGAAYGLRQALDSVGAFIGPLLAMIFLVRFGDNIRAVLWIAVIPAILTVVLLVVAVREPERKTQRERETGDSGKRPGNHALLTRAAIRNLPLRFWLVVVVAAVFTLARFSEAFLVLRAQNVGLALRMVPLVMVVMNIVYAAVSYPAGIAADHFSRKGLLVAGLVVLVAADLVLAAAPSPRLVLAGAALWGMHMGLTQGLFSKLVADTAGAEARGTAFGIYNLVSGGALLLASVIAGLLWNRFGPRATFTAGAAFAAIALVGLTISSAGGRSSRRSPQ